MSRSPYDPDCGLDIASTTIREFADFATIEYFGYRLVRHPEGVIYVHEAYYDYREALLGIARKPASPCADSVEALREVIDQINDALREPILDLDRLTREHSVG